MALPFTIYTAVRSGEVRNARWSHIDLSAKLWNRRVALMKMREDHVVNLSASAIAIFSRIRLLRVGHSDDLVFPSTKGSPYLI